MSDIPVQVYIGSDHGGFQQKERLIPVLQAHGYAVTDSGTHSAESTDYPEFALVVGRQVLANPGSLGILLCRSGEGMQMAANKIPGIRAALVWTEPVARETRNDNDANVLVLPSDFVTQEEEERIVLTFLSTPFSQEERHARRIEELNYIEHAAHSSDEA
jgi:ribose 5-phosphate isomerase B